MKGLGLGRGLRPSSSANSLASIYFRTEYSQHSHRLRMMDDD